MTMAVLFLLAVILGLPASLGMAWLVLTCLIRCRGRALTAWTGVFTAALALLTAGSGGLAALDLAWRAWVMDALYAVLFAGGAGAMIAAVRALPRLLTEWPERSRIAWRRSACLGLCLTVLGALAAMGALTAITTGEERVVARDGAQAVEVDEGWMDRCMVYYPYRGPLVRGRTALEIVSEYVAEEAGR